MRVALLSSLLALVLSACNPGDCQGAGFVTDQVNNQTKDNGAPAGIGNPLCSGAATSTTDDVNVTNQTQLNQLVNCKEVVGNVTILNSSDITDLAPLATLEHITQGYLLIFNNSALAAVELPALQQADYGIGIVDNSALTTAAFPKVVEAFGDITLLNNAVLSNVAFPALEQVHNDARFAGKVENAGNVIVGNNPEFTGFQTFTKLDTIEGFFSVFNNPKLQNFQGLEILTTIRNDGKNAQALAIGLDFDAENDPIAAGNATLQDLTGLGDLDTVGGDIFIGFNPAMTNLTGMDDLTVHNNNIFIVGNDSLQDLSGLDGDGGNDGVNDGLQIVKGSIFIGQYFDSFKQPRGQGNKVLTDLTGLNNLVQLDGSLVLAFNPQLSNFNGLDSLPLIGGDLVVMGSNLDDLQGADVLTTVNGNLIFGQVFGNDDKVLNPVLDVDRQALDPRVTVQLDPNNVGNTAFTALTTVGKDLIVAFSDTGSLRFSDTLTTVNGRLILHDSDLNDLTGFETVNTLGGLFVGLVADKNNNLSAGGNNSFNAFTGLNATNLGAGGLAIGFNNNLNDLATLPVTNVAGSVTIASEDFANLQGFDVATIGGNFVVGAIVNGNEPPVDAGLDNMAALQVDNTTTINGNVLIAFNDNLNDVGMAALQTIGGTFEITNNGGLATIAGSNALNNVGTLFIHDLPNLDTLNLQGLGVVQQNDVITRNPKLATVNTNNLTTVGGTLELSFLANLVDLGFLVNLNTIGNIGAQAGDFILSDNADLADITGLNGLQTVGGDLLIARDGSINELTLNSLSAVGGSFEVAQNDALVDFTHDVAGNAVGLSLGTVGDALRVRQNANLESFKGLETVTNIGLALSIVDNPKLATVLIDTGTQDVADQVDDAGLIALVQVGNPNPLVDGIQGDRGVVEAQNNPLLDVSQQINDLIQDLNGFLGDQGCDTANNPVCGLFFCGNQNAFGTIDPTFDVAACGPATVDAPPAGEGEGEGEGAGQ